MAMFRHVGSFISFLKKDDMAWAVFWYVFYAIIGIIIYGVMTFHFEFEALLYPLAGLFVVIAWKLQEQRNRQ